MADGKWIPGLRADMPLLEAARRVLHVRLQVVRDYLPKAVAEAEGDPEMVHQLRVATRRGDAALRLFRDCLSGGAYREARRRLRSIDRKSTRLNSSHANISYAVFCLKKKKKTIIIRSPP